MHLLSLESGQKLATVAAMMAQRLRNSNADPAVRNGKSNLVGANAALMCMMCVPVGFMTHPPTPSPFPFSSQELGMLLLVVVLRPIVASRPILL